MLRIYGFFVQTDSVYKYGEIVCLCYSLKVEIKYLKKRSLFVLT